MQKAVVLLSGGLDSTTCLAQAHAQGYSCYALSFDYQQRQIAELNAATRIAAHYAVADHQIIQLPLLHLRGSALTDNSVDVPDYVGDDKIPVTYVPARNTTFLSIALGWAEVIDADAIIIGVSAVDYSGYPDCRPEYIQAFQAMAALATKQGVEGKPIRIETPLINLDKAQTIALGQQLGVDYSLTVSCYQASAEGLACGRCDSCYLRRQGFANAKLADPTRYQTSDSIA